MRPAAIIILIMIMGSVFVTPASASDVRITIEKEQVQAKMILSLHQNMTEFPNQTISLNSSRDSNVSSTFTEAIRELAPAAAISNLTFTVNSTKTWLNLTAIMTLSGVSERRGDILAVNATWKAFNMSADLRAGNLSYNSVGSRYLRPVIDFYVNASKFETSPNATINAVNFFVNGTQSVAGETAADQLGNFTTLDFRSLSVPVEQWTRAYNLSTHTTTWSYVPPPLLSASVRAQRLNVSFEIFSDYAYSAEISVPGIARATGNMLLIDVGTSQKELVMAGVVTLVIVLAIATQLLFRAKKRAVRLGRR